MSNELILFTEYNKLKDEQLRRIVSRDHSVYLCITAVCAVLGGMLGVFSNNNEPSILPFGFVLMQWIALLLGWNHLMNDKKVSDIGFYIRTYIASKLKELDPHAFRWEYIHTEDSMRLVRKSTQTVMDVMVFFVPAFVPGLLLLLVDCNVIHLLGITATSKWVIGLATVFCFIALAYLIQLLNYSLYASHKERVKLV